jgi:photosystem II stability/assembly factor-like uncharacterized protein
MSIYFIDANKGFAVGTNSSYASTTNGGTTWTVTEDGGGFGGGVWNSSIFFSSSTTGWIVGDGDPLVTTDGGVNWNSTPNITKADFGFQQMQQVLFTSSSTGYIVGNKGKLAKTTDGGSTWSVSTISTELNYFGIAFGTSSTGWVVGEGGAIDKTVNSGSAWASDVTPVTTESLNATFFINSNTGFAVGENGILIKTINGGTNWTTINLGTTNTLYDIYFTSESVGYICGDAAFYYTDDGGATWTPRAVTYTYYSTKFVNDNIGWAVGSVANGQIIKTINRGASWSVKTPPSPLYDLAIVDASILVAVGYNGSIQRTTDAGNTWSAISSGTTDILRSVAFVNSSIGYISTDGMNSGDPAILKTTDGGATWSTIAFVGRELQSLQFLSELEGWAVSGNESWHTTDGGLTWTAEDVFSNNDLYSIYFPNPTTGYRVGYLGIIDKGTTPTAGLPPVCAENVNPLDPDIDIPVSKNILSMVWNEGGGATPTGYKLYFGTDGGGTTAPTNIVNGTDLGLVTSYSPTSDLLYNTTYYWQIVPTNANGDATNCPIWSFTTRKDINFGGGGLNAPGYFFANSLPSASGAPSQPSYSWVNPVANGHTEILTWTSGDDDDGYFGPHTMGITFPFFGTNFTSLYIGTNGLLTFASGYLGKGTSVTIPESTEPNYMIAACLMDLDDQTDGKIYYGVTGGKFIVTWWHYYDNAASEYITFQVLLSPSGYIEFQYNSSESTFPLQPGIGNDALIGIEDQYGSSGVLYRDNGVGGPIFGSPLALAFGENNGALPVELTSFEVHFDETTGKNVILNWRTATELNNYGFEIQRSGIEANNNLPAEWNVIGFIEGHGNSNSPKDYSFVDANPIKGKSLYRLKQIDIDGGYEYSSIVEVKSNSLNKYLLEQNFPNPFNPSTKINFSIAQKGNVKLTIYNSIGQKISTIVNENKEAGSYSVLFNGENLPSGIYFYKLESGSFTQIQKMILLK